MLHSLRHALALALMPPCLAAAPLAAAAPDTAGVSFDLSNVTLTLVSDVDGGMLPLAWRDAGYELKASQFTTDGAEWSSTVDTTRGYPAEASFSLGPGMETMVLDGPFAGMHGQAGFGSPTAEWRLAAVSGSMFATFDMPAHSTLTLSGHVRIGPDDPAGRTFTGFEAYINTLADGVTYDSFTIGNPESVDTDFRVVSHNASDVSAVVLPGWYGYASVTAPVPEPPMHALLACGLAVGAGLRMRARRRGSRPA
jgi:hypothetical protein